MAKAESILKQIYTNPSNFLKLQVIFEANKSINSQYFALTALKEMVSNNYNNIPIIERKKLKHYLLNELFSKGMALSREVINAILLLLTRLIKLSWFDDPDIKKITFDTKRYLGVCSSLGELFLLYDRPQTI
jgi:Importin-beta N-terminal domain